VDHPDSPRQSVRGQTVSLQKRAALARRTYWQDLYESAVQAKDATAAAEALRFVMEYDVFLALLHRKQ
jgi:hypothetical protein